MNKQKKLFECYQIKGYDDYELHYNDDEQLVYSKFKNRYLKNYLNNNGYYRVNLCNSEGIKTWCLHRLVYTCLKGDIPTDMQVNHINEIKTDNRIDNLNLMTCKENINYGNRNQKVTEKLSIPIVGVHKKTLDVIEFQSTMQAQRTDKRFIQGNISNCCQHKKVKTVNKYYFFFKDEFNQLLEKYKGSIQDIIEYKLSKY